MAAPQGLLRRFAASAGIAGAATLAFAPFAANDAQAQDFTSAASCPSPSAELLRQGQPVQVPMGDLSNERKEVVRTSAARLPVSIAVVVYGSGEGEPLFEQARRAVYDGHSCGFDVGALVKGTAYETPSVDIYVNGLRQDRAVISTAGDEATYQQTMRWIEIGDELIRSTPRATASLDR